MTTRQSLPVNGCDGDGDVGISSWQGIVSHARGRLQFENFVLMADPGPANRSPFHRISLAVFRVMIQGGLSSATADLGSRHE